MKREVVKLVTPGTLLEPLDQHANYLLSIFPGPSHLLGLAWIDLSTAAFQVWEDLTTCLLNNWHWQVIQATTQMGQVTFRCVEV